MGVMDKFLNYMKLNGEEDDYLDEDYLDEEEEEEVMTPPKRKAPVVSPGKIPAQKEEEERPIRRPAVQNNKVTSIKQTTLKRLPNNAGMEVCVIKPSAFEEAREITETLLSNRTVVLNLEGLDVEIAQRIIDFTSGSCFAINGNLQKISHYIFIITPATVDISGDFQDIFGGTFEMSLGN